MALAQTIKLKTTDGLTIVEFLIDVMQDQYKDFQICHRLQAANLLTTYGNEDAPNFIDDNPRETQPSRSGRKPKNPNKFDEELAKVIRNDTGDGQSIARFLIYVMEGEFLSFKPHHRMSAARELLDRGFGKSARKENTVHPEPAEGPTVHPELVEGPTPVHPEPVEGPNPIEAPTAHPELVEGPELVKAPNPIKAPKPSTQETNKIREIPKSNESEFRQILDDLPYSHPDDFEETVHEFLENIGAVRSSQLEYIGDEVTEGIIDLDPVGIEKTYFRAKLSIDPIDELEIRDFSGNLERRAAATGLFITTSDFTDVARRAAETISTGNKPIRLVDGHELAHFIASLDMGVTPDPQKPDENHHTHHT